MLVKIAGALLALVIAGIALQLSGRSSSDLGHQALDYNLGSVAGIEETIVLATPILLAALAVFLCFRMRLWNIGIDGQMLIGAAFAAAIGLHIDGPTWLLLVAMALAGALGGAVWILVPALLRAYLSINEIITTLLLNFVAIAVVQYLAITVWNDPLVSLRTTPEIPYLLPEIPGTSLHVSVATPLLLAALLAAVFRWAVWGYEIDVIGANPRAGAYAGMRVRRRIVLVMLCSGSIAGLSGMIQVAGPLAALSEDVAAGSGLYGFIVAALAGRSIVAVLVVGFLIAMLFHSGIALSTEGVSTDTVVAIYGLVLLLSGLGEVAARYRIVGWRGSTPTVTGSRPNPRPMPIGSAERSE